MTNYAITKALCIESLSAFSTPDGDEYKWGLSWDEVMDTHPHAKALRAALASFGETAFTYKVSAASAHREWRICLTCENPDESQNHSAEQAQIVEAAGLSIIDGIADESGDHALVG